MLAGQREYRLFPGITLCCTAAPEPFSYRNTGLCTLEYCHKSSIQIQYLGWQAALHGGDVWVVPPEAGECTGLGEGYAAVRLVLAPQAPEVETLFAGTLGAPLSAAGLVSSLSARAGHVLSSDPALRTAFSQLAGGQSRGEAFLRLKTLEILLLLNAPEPLPALEGTWRQEERVREICRYLTEHLEQRMTQADVAKAFHISLTALKATFRQIYGMPMDTYLRRERLRLARQLLQKTDLSVVQIAEQLGYSSHSQFSAAFRAGTGCTPTAFRRGEDAKMSNFDKEKTNFDSAAQKNVL